MVSSDTRCRFRDQLWALLDGGEGMHVPLMSGPMNTKFRTYVHTPYMYGSVCNPYILPELQRGASFHNPLLPARSQSEHVYSVRRSYREHIIRTTVGVCCPRSSGDKFFRKRRPSWVITDDCPSPICIHHLRNLSDERLADRDKNTA